ncbi:hypothetical protein MKZ38_002351 [Zalerion maritima]|uniref:Chromosome transmission fidelity protein 8 n=1 Tax=Zalerion maritima TaxID=339359 RepID=A0AAD5S578_9PEZI|nr:hypothetical protein MKZ38_002351 [Zalerion maritima]
MSSIKLYPPQKPKPSDPNFFSLNPLPQVLQTPTGLAILELQGTINLPHVETREDGTVKDGQEAQIGRLVFPDYNPDFEDPQSTAWMKKVYLFVGQHQRLQGEAKKLPKAIAVIKRRDMGSAKNGDVGMMRDDDEFPEELEVVDIVKYKLVFSQRPEPVGT